METELKFKVGDRVRVKSLEWYNDEPKNINGDIYLNGVTFVEDMKKYCEKTLTIIKIIEDCYIVEGSRFCWQDWMFEDDAVTEEKQEVEQLNKNNMETKKMTLKEAQEFVRNTKYIVFSEDECKKLQTKLFKIGCYWGGYKHEVKHLECKFIFVNDNLCLSYGTMRCCEIFDKSDKEIRNVDDVISVEIEEPKPKFDPNSLQPFDKVLVRRNEKSIWLARFYEYSDNVDFHVTNGGAWKFCIPYNDDTKHLHRTHDEAPEFYRLD